MCAIYINHVRYETNGSSNIVINNNSIYVGGTQVGDKYNGIVEIKFEGDLASLSTGGNATINGNVKGDVEAGGNVHCGDVYKNVDAGGNVHCGKVEGGVDAGGNVNMKR